MVACESENTGFGGMQLKGSRLETGKSDERECWKQEEGKENLTVHSHCEKRKTSKGLMYWLLVLCCKCEGIGVCSHRVCIKNLGKEAILRDLKYEQVQKELKPISMELELRMG